MKEESAKNFIGFDLGKVSSQVCIIAGDGELIKPRVRTDREHIAGMFEKGRPGFGPYR